MALPDFFVEVHTGAGLERYGGSVEEVINFFPKSNYSLFIRKEDENAFRPLEANTPLPDTRFYLVALADAESE